MRSASAKLWNWISKHHETGMFFYAQTAVRATKFDMDLECWSMLQYVAGLSAVWRLESRRVLTYQWFTSFVDLCGVQASALLVMRSCSTLWWEELGAKLRQAPDEISADFLLGNSSIGSWHKVHQSAKICAWMRGRTLKRNANTGKPLHIPTWTTCFGGHKPDPTREPKCKRNTCAKQVVKTILSCYHIIVDSGVDTLQCEVHYTPHTR